MKKKVTKQGQTQQPAPLAQPERTNAASYDTPSANLTDGIGGPITYTEWLHSRLLSRAGIPELPANDSPHTSRRIPLFLRTLGCGGHWDW